MRLNGTRAAAPRVNTRQARDDRESACRFVMALVAAWLGVDAPALAATGRGSAKVAFARSAAMYLVHVKLGMTMTEVGRQFGRDRTTVSHACRRIEDARDDRRFDALLSRLEGALDRWRTTFLEARA